MSKVTFIMMAYNTENYIEQAVRSVLNQTEKDVNIIVRNNGSTDRTGEILDRLALEDNRVYVMHNKTNGITDTGVGVFQPGWWFDSEEYLGEYISVLDSDDYIASDFTEKLYNKAVAADADITFTGNYFVYGEKITGKRVPPHLDSSYAKDIGDNFDGVHGCFRTWWGKLFKKEFFTSNYIMAWGCYPPIWWNIDTVIMMKYLSVAKRISTIEEPLYYMRLRNTSTYKTRTIDCARILEAYSIYEAMYETITSLGLRSDKNIKYLSDVHWGYLKELIDALPENNMPLMDKYRWLEDVVSDGVCSKYLAKNFQAVFFQLKSVLDKLADSRENENIYKSYLARLNEFINMVQEDDRNPLAYIVLMGVICDLKNISHFGMDFLELPLSANTAGVEKAKTFHYAIKMQWVLGPDRWVGCIESIDKTDEIEELEKKLIECHKTDENRALDIAIDIIIKCPVNLTAIIYIMDSYKKAGNSNDYNLLNETVRVIWSCEELENIKNILA